MQAVDLLSDVAKSYCTEYARQARDLFRDETWDAIEPRIRHCWPVSYTHLTLPSICSV